MGFSFWYLGSGVDAFFFPQAIGLYHREYFLGLRQEEVVLATHRMWARLKGSYINGVDLVDENGNVYGSYSPYFIGAVMMWSNRDLNSVGWSMGVGPGVMYGRIYDWQSYALTLNAFARGYFPDAEVLITLQNLGIAHSSESGFGKVFTLPELYAGGKKFFGNFGLGIFGSLYADADIDAGIYGSVRFPFAEIYVAPSYKYLSGGLNLQMGSLVFGYSYEHITALGYGTHRIGFSFLFEKQRLFERTLERHERILSEHERRLRRVERKIEEMEREARTYAWRLVEDARSTEDPEEALRKLEIARALLKDSTLDREMDSLRELLTERKREEYLGRIKTLYGKGMYPEALAEVYLMLEEFPGDSSALRYERMILRKLRSKKAKQETERAAREKVRESKVAKAKRLLRKGRIVEASRIINSLPDTREKRELKSEVERLTEDLMARAKKAIAQKKYVEAKYYLEMVLKVQPNTEASALLTWVIQKIKEDAASLYLKALSYYQKGDVLKAYIYVKQAYEMDPENERYRGVYFRLKNAVEKGEVK